MDEIDEMGEIGLHFALLARATSLSGGRDDFLRKKIPFSHTNLLSKILNHTVRGYQFLRRLS